MNGQRKAPPVYSPFRPNTLQALPRDTAYAKWKAKAEENNGKYPDFRIDFNRIWDQAPDIATVIAALKGQVTRAEAARSRVTTTAPASAFVALPPKEKEPVVAFSAPPPTPVSRAPAPGSEEHKVLVSMFTSAPLPPTARRVPVPVDPYAGLSANVRGWATGIEGWTQAGMAGVGPVTMTQQEQEELTRWVLARRTGGGNQKFAVIIGQGSGMYSAVVQYKVIGYAQRNGGTAMTYHITLATHSYRPATLPARSGF